MASWSWTGKCQVSHNTRRGFWLQRLNMESERKDHRSIVESIHSEQTQWIWCIGYSPPRILTVHHHYSNPPDSHPDFSQLGPLASFPVSCQAQDSMFHSRRFTQNFCISHAIVEFTPCEKLLSSMGHEAIVLQWMQLSTFQKDWLRWHEKHRESKCFWLIAWLLCCLICPTWTTSSYIGLQSVEFGRLEGSEVHVERCWIILSLESGTREMMEMDQTKQNEKQSDRSLEWSLKGIRNQISGSQLNDNEYEYESVQGHSKMFQDFEGYPWIFDLVSAPRSLCLASVMLVSSDSSHRDNSSLSFTYENVDWTAFDLPF